jgi:5-methoxybenzimidazole methyltransferase
MRILLMMAPTLERQFSVHAGANYPLALAQIAAGLEGHELLGYDPDIDPGYPGSFAKVLRDFDPEVVGISFRIFDTTLSYEPHSYLGNLEAAVRAIRATLPNTIITLGGPAFSFFPEPLMKRLAEVDVGFFLEGDRTFPQFVDEPSAVADIPGIYYRDNGEVKFTGRCDSPSFEELATPRFDLFPLLKYQEYGDLAIGLESKRGCKLNCTPCVYPYLTGNKVISKPAEKIVAEAQALASAGVKSFFFLDSIFNIPHTHAREISRALLDANLPITWGAFYTAAKFDEELFDLSYRSGCRNYFFAPDGISEKAIKTYRRPITKSRQKQAIELVQTKPDAHIHISYLLGSPGETFSDLAEFAGTLFYLIRRRIFSMSLSYTRIYPHTKIREVAVKEGVISAEDDLLEPKWYVPYPSSLARFIFHPVYRAVHGFMRIIKKREDRKKR